MPSHVLSASRFSQMFRLIPVIFVGCMANLAHCEDYREQSVLGKWKLTKAVDSSQITSLDEREAERLVGKIFIIRADKVQFGNRTCPAPELSAEIVEPRLYLRKNAHADATHMGLPNPVTVVELGCTIAFIKSPDRLLIHWGGWFFDARRIR